MNKIIIPQHDTGYQEQFTIFTDATHSTVQDLTGYTVKCKVWERGDASTLKVDSTCTAPTPTNGICYWTISSTFTATTGFYFGELQLEKDSVVMSTIPFEVSVVESAS